jgi:hypothetical protein
MKLKTLSLTTLLILAGLTSANAHVGDHSHVLAETGLTHFLFDHGLIALFLLAAIAAIMFPSLRNR